MLGVSQHSDGVFIFCLAFWASSGLLGWDPSPPITVGIEVGTGSGQWKRGNIVRYGHGNTLRTMEAVFAQMGHRQCDHRKFFCVMVLM